MLAGAAARFHHVARFAGKEWLQHRPDRAMVAVKRRGVETTIGFDRPAVLAEFHDTFSHDILPDFAKLACFKPRSQEPQNLTHVRWYFWNIRPFSGASREFVNAASPIPPSTLSAERVYALNSYILEK